MTDAEFHKVLIDNLSTALLVLDPELRVSFISPAAQALLEFSEGRTLGKTLAQLIPDQPQLQAGVESASASQAAYTNRGVSLCLTSGHELTVDCTVTPVTSEAADSAGIILEIHPVDRIMRINREEGLIASQETTQALVRGLAHEIKNPLGGLRGAAQLLARELPDPALEEYTRIIIEESDRLRDLVDRMLGPRRQPQLAPVNVHEVLEHTRTLVQAEVGDLVRFERDYDPSVPQLSGDRSQLIQAVLNIVRNAILATEDNEGERLVRLRTRVQRQLTIGMQHHKLVCRIDIEDNGPGVPAALMDSIFIPMVSGRASGSGLGLAISQSIINQHGGLIECHSEPGRAEFTLYIPLDAEYAKNG